MRPWPLVLAVGCAHEIEIHESAEAPRLAPSPLRLPAGDCGVTALEIHGEGLVSLRLDAVSGDPEALQIPVVRGDVAFVELAYCPGEEPLAGLLTAVFEASVAHVWVEEE